MSLPELLKIFSLAIGLFITVVILNFLLRYCTKKSSRVLLFRLGVFLLFCVLFLLTPTLINYLNISEFSQSFIKVIDVCWWFSLYLLANECFTFFIWNRLLLNTGINVSKLLRDLVTFILIILTIAGIFHFALERSVVGLFTASGILAIIIGYSAQATLGEAFSGIGLNITKQFEIGEWIGLTSVYGKVVDINWRFVTILTLDGNYLSILNSQIVKEKITNYSRPAPHHGVTIKVPVQIGLSPQTVKNLLISAAIQSSKISLLPAPQAFLCELQSTKGENIYELSCHTTELNVRFVIDEILSIFWYQSQRVTTVDSESNPCGTTYSTDDIQTFLNKVDLFSSLGQDEISHLATSCSYKRYGPPERLLMVGQPNNSLFLIYQGSVDIYIRTSEGQELKVATMNEGSYLGEMSLLTGEPTTTSVIVNKESIIIEITYEKMATLFAKNPALIENISSVIVQRKSKNENVRASMKKDIKQEEKSIVARIKNFFKIHI